MPTPRTASVRLDKQQLDQPRGLANPHDRTLLGGWHRCAQSFESAPQDAGRGDLSTTISGISSPTSALVTGPAPTTTAAATLSGPPLPGQQLDCTPPTRTPANPSDFVSDTFSRLSNGNPISSQTELFYTVQPGDVGNQIACKDTATNETVQLPRR
jgi:hypothetical protein